VERALSVLADEMLEDVIEFACKLAKHRGSQLLARDDVKLAINKRYKLKVPTKLHSDATVSGSSNAQLPVLPQNPVSTSNYKSNLALIKKAQEHPH
jgi:transcription initiation factor TFIID subunit TAF12